MKLADIQQALCASLVGSDSVESTQSLLLSLRQTGISAETGLKIYQANHVGAFIQALGQVYPVCAAIVGARPFSSLCRNYLQTCPATHWNLDLYGDYFPSLLSRLCATHAALGELDYLPDLAQLEWYWHAAYYAAKEVTDQPLKISIDQQLTDNIRVQTKPGLHVFRTALPIYDIWRAHRESGNTQHIEALGSDQYLLIQRSDYTVHVDLIDEDRYRMLKACETQPSLINIIEQFDAASVATLIGDGWLTLALSEMDSLCETLS